MHMNVRISKPYAYAYSIGYPYAQAYASFGWRYDHACALSFAPCTGICKVYSTHVRVHCSLSTCVCIVRTFCTGICTFIFTLCTDICTFHTLCTRIAMSLYSLRRHMQPSTNCAHSFAILITLCTVNRKLTVLTRRHMHCPISYGPSYSSVYTVRTCICNK